MNSQFPIKLLESVNVAAVAEMINAMHTGIPTLINTELPVYSPHNCESKRSTKGMYVVRIYYPLAFPVVQSRID